MPQFLTYFADELITVSSPFGCHHLPTYCTISPCQLTTFPFFTLFRSSVTLSSQHPSQATWTCHLGCLGRMCSLPPLPSYPVSSICNFSSFKPSLSCMTPFTSNHGMLPWLPQWGHTCDPSVWDFTKAALLLFFRACMGFSVPL